MTGGPIRRVVIVGGGTAGWMSAAALGHVLRDTPLQVTLVESEAIGTVGVGEATIPEILKFNALLGIGEAEFLRETKATFKLGIEFDGWRVAGERYFHPFGVYGLDMGGIAFHHHWLRARAEGAADPLDAYCLAWAAARDDRFAHPSGGPASPLSCLRYAYHFDAILYAAFLRRRAEAAGVVRHEGRVASVRRRDDGAIAAVALEDGRELAGDLFLDCSGFGGLLIERTLESGYDDWSHWLPCDSAVAAPCARVGPLTPYTRATARPAGWQWRIPLQHRVGNGHVYSSRHTDHDTARETLLAHMESEPLAEPRRLAFTTGKRRRLWVGNCVAIGLAGGFLEPLESTGIHLIQSSLNKLISLFPARLPDPLTAATFNRLMDAEFETIRDFLILHYKATERSGTSFWDHVRTMSVPDRLADKLALFRQGGRILRDDDEIFAEPSWLAVAIGQGVVPTGWHPIADGVPLAEARRRLAAIRDTIARAAASLPRHEETVALAIAG